MEVVYTIQSILSVINCINAKVELVENNIERSKVLSGRCQSLCHPLIVLQNEKDNIQKLSSILRLKDVIEDCSSFIDSLSGKSWRRLCMNCVYASDIASQFDHLNTCINNAALDLHLSVTVDFIAKNENAKKIDEDRIFAYINEMLVANGQFNHEMKASISQQNIALIDKIQRLENMFYALFKQTSTLLDIVDSVNGDNDSCIDRASAVDHSNMSTQINNTIPLQQSKKVPNNTTTAKYTVADINMSQLNWNASCIDSIIGKGTFGSVFKVKYYEVNVALKHIPGIDGTMAASDIKKIKREAIIMQNCLHRNIVTFLGANIEKGLILMELASCSLHDILHKKRNDNRSLALIIKYKIMIDVAHAIRYLHFHDVIHRDIKTANILLFISGHNINAKVTDFGMAHAYSMTLQSTIHDKNNAGNRGSMKALGTVPYMSPELLDFEGDFPIYSPAVDVYSFGIIMNEMMSGCQPWQGLRDPQILSKVVLKQHRPALFQADQTDTMQVALVELIGTSRGGCLHQLPASRPCVNTACSSLEQSYQSYYSSSCIEVDALILPPPPIKPPRRKSPVPATVDHEHHISLAVIDTEKDFIAALTSLDEDVATVTAFDALHEHDKDSAPLELVPCNGNDDYYFEYHENRKKKKMSIQCFCS